MLLIEVSSTEALPLEECCDAVQLPADMDDVMAATRNMLLLDASLRLEHPTWVSDGYNVPLGAPGCTAWIADVDGRTAKSWRLFWESVRKQRPQAGGIALRPDDSRLQEALSGLLSTASPGDAGVPPQSFQQASGAD
ncbi:hypothetical protein QMO56_09125 [Roseomonas sp. E05]|uniref:hypothetical protein n=1 Tax=Roseomonas sp. E05 TaxID=3046310 RepID=UPI0024B94106|nr:hypothetical protein [Roseomonas sp. E05]MDJ0388274.1 hypothetical protein [Roseomonas sp. E05]